MKKKWEFPIERNPDRGVYQTQNRQASRKDRFPVLEGQRASPGVRGMVFQEIRREVPMENRRCGKVTTNRRRKSRVRVWFFRNTLWLALMAIIVLSFSIGAISCLTVVGEKDDTTSPTTTVLQPDIPTETMTPIEPITEPEVFYFDVPLSDGFQDYIEQNVLSTMFRWSL